MTIKALVNGAEIRGAISNCLYRHRSVNSVYISSMNFHDPRISKKNTLLSMIKILSSKCNVTILIGEEPEKIENKYYDVANSIKELILDYDVNFFYHDNIHAKQILVDDKKESIIFIGSCNFTDTALTQMFEIGIIIYVKNEEESNVYRKFLDNVKKKVRGCNLISVDPITNCLECR